MAHLKKGADGHLLKGGGGHLLNECSAVNTCHNCDPAIPNNLKVTGSGFGGDFAIWNGDTTVVHIGVPAACLWGYNYPTYPYVALEWISPDWYVFFRINSTCGLTFKGPDTPCDTKDDYTWHECKDGGCSGSCDASSGGTCEVSNV